MGYGSTSSQGHSFNNNQVLATETISLFDMDDVMEIGTSENFSHGQIGSNSQNYGGSAGSSSIHNGNNFGQMNANGYGSSQISNARLMSMSGKSSQSNMRSMVGTLQGSSNMASDSRSSTPQPMPKLQFADVEHAGTPQDTTFMTHGMVSGNSGNVMFQQNQGFNSAHMVDVRSSSNVNGMMDQNYRSDAALSNNKGSNLNIGMLDQSYKSVGYY